MSVDYDAYFGIGYQVEASDELKEVDELEDGVNEYLYDKLSEGFSSFQTGSAYSGEYDGVFVTVINPFEDGLDLTSVKERLDAELERLKLKPVGEFSDVGGLLVC